MSLKKILFLGFFVSFILSGCNLTNEEKDKLDKASDNLEKEALQPKIDFPAENRELSERLTVLVDIDDSIEYKSVTLKVEGREITELTEEPYEFPWDPYFWSVEGVDQAPVTLSVRAVTANNNLLRSEVRNVIIDSSIKDALYFTTPTSNQEFKNINQLNIEWVARDGAVNYEYQINNEASVNTANTEAAVDLTQVGEYQLKIRATNELGYAGAWSTPLIFSLLPPDAPTLGEPNILQTDMGWQVDLSWSGASLNTNVQIATDPRFNSVVEIYSTQNNNISGQFSAGIYFARVRTNNEFGHTSYWSEVREYSVGLFSQKIDMAQYGWDTSDNPIDFVINDQDIVIAARKSDEGDGSGDDFYVTKINLNGTVEWGNSFVNFVNSPQNISKTETGYILSGRGKQWTDAGILSIDESGNRQWHKIIEPITDTSAKTRTSETISDIVEISQNNYVFLQKTRNCELNDTGNYAYYECPQDKIENKVIYLERSDNTGNVVETETEYLLAQPISGTYSELNKLLLTESALYAAGKYTASGDTSSDASDDSFTPTASSSGAVLLNLDKTDGNIVSERIGGGIKDSIISSLIEDTNGNILVGYNNYYTSAVTSFIAGTESSESVLNNSLNYAKVVENLKSGGFTLIGDSRSTKRAMMVRYDENNQQIGSSISFTNCFRDLSVKAVKSHPNYGTVILGTDKNGFNSSDTHTVFFNISNNLKYTCPE